MLYSGIIFNGEQISLKPDEILPYIKNLINSNHDLKKDYEIFLNGQMIVDDINYEEYAVRVLGMVIIENNTVYYQEGTEGIDKIEYLRCGYNLQKKKNYVLKNGRYVEYISPIELEVRRLGMPLVNKPENELSFWYPKTANIGFKTPDTLITEFTDEELNSLRVRILKILTMNHYKRESKISL